MKHKHIQSAPAAGAQNTTAPVMASDCSGVLPEFGRVPDVTRLFGLKRGFIYQLLGASKIKSVNLRKPGARTGCRLIHLQSVRAFLHAQMEGQS